MVYRGPFLRAGAAGPSARSLSWFVWCLGRVGVWDVRLQVRKGDPCDRFFLWYWGAGAWGECSKAGGAGGKSREPKYSGAEKVGLWELLPLAGSSHPSVAAFARALMAGAPIIYDGDPLQDLTLSAFLDKFVARRPKVLALFFFWPAPCHAGGVPGSRVVSVSAHFARFLVCNSVFSVPRGRFRGVCSCPCSLLPLQRHCRYSITYQEHREVGNPPAGPGLRGEGQGKAAGRARGRGRGHLQEQAGV